VSYPYSAENRLRAPNTYTYTEFKGHTFVRNFGASRTAALESLTNPVSGQLNCPPLTHEDVATSLYALSDVRTAGLSVYPKISFVDDIWTLSERPFSEHSDYQDLEMFAEKNVVNTLDLLRCLLEMMQSGKVSKTQKLWCDRLTQRFEVTKKIYARYGHALRKGRGSSEDVGLYMGFAILLCLSYHVTENVKYLNALLKLNDTLVSLSPSFQSCRGFRIALSTSLLCEGEFLQDLCRHQGVSFGPF